MMSAESNRGPQLPPEIAMEPISGERLQLLRRMYREMLLIRRFEEAAARAYAGGKFGGFCHLYIGQEAAGVGSMLNLRSEDYVVSTYRDHGHALIRGMEPRGLMAELFGKRSGCSRGKGGSMHFFDKERNFMGGHGIVGGHVALATGIGWAIRYRKEKAVCICYFGDGAANIGAFHEGLNLASLWQLPVLFVCENNYYSMGTPLYRSLSVENVSIRGVAYNMERETMRGDDVLHVYDRFEHHVERTRNGGGPALLEISTYRFRGHSMSDPAKYRTKEELDTYKSRDPLMRAKEILAMSGISADDLAKVDAEVKSEVDDSVRFADASEPPPAADLYTNVLA